MSLQRTRLTTRRLMVLVAGVALLASGARLAWQRVRWARLAREYGEYAASFDRNERKAFQRIQVEEHEVAETERERELLRTEIALSA